MYFGYSAIGWLAQYGTEYTPAAPYNWWWAWWVWVGGFFLLLLILFLIAHGVRDRGPREPPPPDVTDHIPPATPLEALRGQYERGEITREEYERKKKALER